MPLAKIISSRLWRGSQNVLSRARTLGIVRRVGIPDICLYFGAAPGDDLLCSAVLRELRTRGRSGIFMLSDHPQLFAGSTDADGVLPADACHLEFARAWARDFRYLEYAPFNATEDRSTPPTRHIIAELCARSGLSGTVVLRPNLTLTEAEIGNARWAAELVAIQCGGVAGRLPMKNKQWFTERFQAVVNALTPELQFVQIGARSDPHLAGALDFRGKTSVREAAALLSWVRLYVGQVGFLMHLARSVECPAVIIYGGREAPWQSGYSGNINLYRSLPCAPCWRWNTCDFRHACMDQVMVSDVTRAIRSRLQEARGPLAVDTYDLD
jgi:hypothetical protein